MHYQELELDTIYLPSKANQATSWCKLLTARMIELLLMWSFQEPSESKQMTNFAKSSCCREQATMWRFTWPLMCHCLQRHMGYRCCTNNTSNTTDRSFIISIIPYSQQLEKLQLQKYARFSCHSRLKQAPFESSNIKLLHCQFNLMFTWENLVCTLHA